MEIGYPLQSIALPSELQRVDCAPTITLLLDDFKPFLLISLAPIKLKRFWEGWSCIRANNNRTEQNMMMTPEWERYFLARGARWGDLVVYDVEEMHEILSKPSRKEAPTLVEVVVTVRPARPALPCTYPQRTASRCTYEPQRTASRCTYEPQRIITGVRCKGCSYSRHTSPPDDFSGDQLNYCCAICQLSNGKKHGGRCQRIQLG